MSLKLRQILERAPKESGLISTHPEATVQEAIDLLCEHRVGALAVLHPGTKKLMGIITESDALHSVWSRHRDVLPTEKKVWEIMSREVICAQAEEEVARAASIMTAKHIRHLPVMEGEEIAGMVTLGDLLREMVQEDELKIHSLSDYLGGTYGLRVY